MTLGLPIVESTALPLHPTHREDARRIVRHGLADVLAWLGEHPGPRPGEPTHALIIGGRLLVSSPASARIVGQLKPYA